MGTVYRVYVNNYLVGGRRLFSDAKKLAKEMVAFLESFYADGKLRQHSVVEIAIPDQKMRMKYAEVQVDVRL